MRLSAPRWSEAAPWQLARWPLLLLLAVWALASTLRTPAPVPTSALALALVGLLAASPRFPVTALVGVFAGLLAWGALAGEQADDPFVAMLVLATYGVGRYAPVMRQPWAAAGVLLLLGANLGEDAREATVADAVFPVLLTAGPWLLGLAVQIAMRRERTAVAYARQVDATREEEVRRATAEERLRIARELHDEVTHSISALSLQAQVLRRALAAGGTVDQTDLRGIEATAQQAMTDLRRLLGLLRPGEEAPLEPQRGLGDVDTLVKEARAAGQRVRLSRQGTPREVAPVLGAAAYRILQESLTNARRHGAGVADVVLRQTPDTVEIEVSNPHPGGEAPPPGHGTRGMRERVELFGGELVCGPRGDRWVVEAVLPAPTREVAQ
jgi:signal transduction histidine kinase